MSFSISYPPLADVPLLINVQKPNLISLPLYQYHPIISSEIESLNYDFHLETTILESSIKQAALETAHQEAETARRTQLENERRERNLRETQRRAPGLNLEGEILQPTLANVGLGLAPMARTNSVDSVGNKANTTTVDGGSNNTIIGSGVIRNLSPPIGGSDVESIESAGDVDTADGTKKASRKPTNFSLLEFEHGLAPPDPWDVVKKTDEELSDLNTVFGGSARPAAATSNQGPVAPSHPPPRPPVSHSLSIPVPATTDSPSPPRFQTTPRIQQPQPSSTNARGGGIPTPFQRAQQQQQQQYDASLSNGMSKISPNPPQPVPPPKPPKPSTMYSTASPPIPGLKPSNYSTHTNSSNSSSGSLSGSPPRHSSPAPVSAGIQMPPGLSSTMQEMYIKMINMGFAPSAIERAFRACGSDEKRVLDFLVAHADYVSKGFKSENIEVSLSLYDSAKEPDKCQKFLTGFSAMAEMGFSRPKIQEALILKGLDQEQAMEFLLAEGGAS